jgi:hypothetical protein
LVSSQEQEEGKEGAVGATEVELKLGVFFKEKFGKDPRDLTLEEIDAIAVRKSGEGYRSPRHVVTTRGSIFKGKLYNIEKLFDEAIKK